MKKRTFIVAAFLAALVAFCAIAFLVFTKRATPAFYGDLVPTRFNISSNENAFYVLEDASGELSWPKNSKPIDKMIRCESWDQKFASEILHSNKTTLEVLDKATQRGHLQVPEIRGFEASFDYLQRWKSLSQLLILRSLDLFHEGKEQEALNSALQAALLGNQMENCDGLMIHYLVGSAVKNMSFRVVRNIVANSTLPCDSMQFCLQELDHLYADKAALTNVIKMEYRLQSKQIDDLASGKLTGQNPPSGIKFFRPLFDPEQTRKIYAQFARNALNSIQLPYGNMPTNPVVFSTNSSTLKILLSGNSIGKLLAQMTLPSSEKFMSRKCAENVNVAATRVICALKCYKQKYQRLPSSLEELVPEFLSQIPMDDFDGKPLRYSAERKIVYSVGANLTDAGGQEKNSKNNADDLPFEIGF